MMYFLHNSGLGWIRELQFCSSSFPVVAGIFQDGFFTYMCGVFSGTDLAGVSVST